MHSGNYVVDMTPDFDETVYRIRAIDFDQQCYEPRCSVYLPQYYKENNPIIFLGMRTMTPETTLQYQEEERTLTRIRAQSERARLDDLLDTMSSDVLAPPEHVEQLAAEMSAHYEDPRFLGCQSMGALVRASLERLRAA